MAKLRQTAAEEAGTDAVMNEELENPLNEHGRKVKGSMEKQYGKKKGEKIFYATMNTRGMKHKWEGK